MDTRCLRVGLALVVAGCVGEAYPDPPPIALEQFVAEHAEWRSTRRDRLVMPPGGAVLWSGLWELQQGANPFGSDPALRISLPADDSPPLAGTLYRTGQDIRLEPAPGSPVQVRGGDPISVPIAMVSDRNRDATGLALGSLGLRIHGEPGTDRLWLRMWDEDHPLRQTFALPETYPPDPAWRVMARMERYPEVRPLPVADVTGGVIGYTTPGELVFEIEREEYRLIAVGNENSQNYMIMMWDETANVDTYQAMRYLSVPAPDSTGWTVIDFNRAYNPPCVFTEFSVCALPPAENRLPVAITAGEKRWTKPGR
jgi:uncharacterized protein (DUF1684 family)